MRKHMKCTRQNGFSIMEVLIGVFIFAVGLLALSALQGALTRSMADAKVRTTAANIAELTIESNRNFSRLLTDTVGSPPVFAYNDIVDDTSTVPANGINYTVAVGVTDYYYQLLTDSYTTTSTGGSASDYKQIVVTVSWDAAQNFRGDEGTELTAADLGSGNVVLTSVIPAIISSASARVANEGNNGAVLPSISYTPGENPDIVSLGLGDNKFKESLTPEPKVFRDNLETRFDVITYSQSGSDALFLRREEFVAVSCECTLNAEDEENPGKTPVVWAGDEYTEPELMTKPYGIPISTVAQSSLCQACCRDHHDGGGALYDPFRPDAEYSSGSHESGNHKHYSRSGGVFVEAGNGDDYLEACRMVRKDGFFRVGQDFRLEGLNTFEENFLVNTDQVEAYSDYVIGEVYEEGTAGTYVVDAIGLPDPYQLAGTPPTVDSAPRTDEDDVDNTGDLTTGYTYLPTFSGAEFQQLRSRGIYIDNLSSDLRAVITCIEGTLDTVLAADPGVCDQGDVKLDRSGSTNILELLPFFEVQTTYLNDWRIENPGTVSFTLTNEPVETSDANGPVHSRGLATNETPEASDWVNVYANRGVTGLSSSDPISELDRNYRLPEVDGYWPPGDIEVIANLTSPPPTGGRVVTGTLSSEVPGVKAANVTFNATNAICNFATTSGEFTCFIPDSLDTVTMTLSGFDKPPKVIYVCSSHQFGSPAELPVNNEHVSSDPKDVDLTNALSAPTSPYSLYLTLDACPSA